MVYLVLLFPVNLSLVLRFSILFTYQVYQTDTAYAVNHWRWFSRSTNVIVKWIVFIMNNTRNFSTVKTSFLLLLLFHWSMSNYLLFCWKSKLIFLGELMTRVRYHLIKLFLNGNGILARPFGIWTGAYRVLLGWKPR